MILIFPSKNGTAGLVLLWPSSEHIPIVRAPGAPD